jgi:choline transport protein
VPEEERCFQSVLSIWPHGSGGLSTSYVIAPNFLVGTITYKISQISLVYIALTTILFLFPPSLPATGSSMSKMASHILFPETNANLMVMTDYCVAAFGVVFIISTIQWFVDGRKNFVGPRIEVEVFTGEAGPQPEQPIPFVEQHKS